MNEIDREALKCPNCSHEVGNHFASVDYDPIGSCWETPMCDCQWLPETIRTHGLTAKIAALRDERDRRWTLGQIESMLDYVTTATTFHQNTGEWSGADTVRELKRLFSAHNPDGTYRDVRHLIGSEEGQ